ncbi:UNVERIFIED_CONTAM: hypothetical protein GTU68_005864 [Idotea baltica]|nr:hypothetical protein [Idotea baltica]
MYEVAARKHNIRVKRERLTAEFQLPSLNSDSESKLIFVCSPNNPTGNSIDVSSIESLAAASKAYIVVDEAYIDFAEPASALSLIEKYENVIILRTFSKAWGLAAVRLGYVVARPELIALLCAIKPPYNLGSFAAAIGLKALNRASAKQACVERIVSQRALLAEQLKQLAIVKKVFPSDANFLLTQFRSECDSSEVQQFLRARGIIVRNRSALAGCENCLRISVGTERQNESLLLGLAEYIGEK